MMVAEGEVAAAIHLAGLHQHAVLLDEALQLHRFQGEHASRRPPSLVYYHTLVEAHAACDQLPEAFGVLAQITADHPDSDMVRSARIAPVETQCSASSIRWEWRQQLPCTLASSRCCCREPSQALTAEPPRARRRPARSSRWWR
jgi:hypothetical protein